jgi:hypothetical protein
MATFEPFSDQRFPAGTVISVLNPAGGAPLTTATVTTVAGPPARNRVAFAGLPSGVYRAEAVVGGQRYSFSFREGPEPDLLVRPYTHASEAALRARWLKARPHI